MRSGLTFTIAGICVLIVNYLIGALATVIFPSIATLTYNAEVSKLVVGTLTTSIVGSIIGIILVAINEAIETYNNNH